jgi:ubiquinol oxidase
MAFFRNETHRVDSAEELRAEQERTLASKPRPHGFLAGSLFLVMDLLYGRKRTLQKCVVLEIIARVPYQAWEHVAYIALTHVSSRPQFARRVFEFVKQSRNEQDNEQWHMFILEELVAKKNLGRGIVRFFILPQIMAFTYYQISWLLYVIKPSLSYSLNVAFEDHAEREYMNLVRENPEFENELWESDFKRDYGDYRTVADLLRRIGMDERIHKEASLERMAAPRFS